MARGAGKGIWIRWIRRLLVAVLVSALVAAGALAGYKFVGRWLCRLALQQIASLTHTQIQTGNVKFLASGQVIIDRLVVRSRQAGSCDVDILQADRVHAHFSGASLLRLHPRLKRLDVNDFVFNAQYDLESGRWNISDLKLKFPKGDGGQLPLVRLRRGVLRYIKTTGPQHQVVLSVPVSAEFAFRRQPRAGYAFTITTGPLASGLGQSRLEGFWRPGLVTLAGGISSTQAEPGQLTWTIDVLAAELAYEPNDDFTLKLHVKDFNCMHSPPLDRVADLGREILEKSTPFASVRKFFQRYQPYGRVDVELSLSGNFKQLPHCSLRGRVMCKDVGIRYASFPYLLERIRGTVVLTEDSARFENLRAWHGQTELSLSGYSRGFGENWTYEIRIKSPHMPLDKDLYQALPDAKQRLWSQLSPTGTVAVDYHLLRRSPTDKKRTLLAELQGIRACYERIPYPLENLSGQVRFEAGRVYLQDITSSAQTGRTIRINGVVEPSSGSGIGYDLSLQLAQLPIDSTLLSALPQRQRQIIEQLQLQGIVGGTVRIVGEPNNGDSADYTAELHLHRASLRAQPFALPLTDIEAETCIAPGRIDIRRCTGRYGRIPLSLTGWVSTAGEPNQLGYELAVTMRQVALDQRLFELLPEHAARLVASLEPTGRVNVTAKLRKDPSQDKGDYLVTVECLGNTLQAQWFPYPLAQLRGTVTIEPGRLVLKNLSATPGEAVWVKADTSAIKLDGTIDLMQGRFGGAKLRLTATDIFFDRRLVEALPGPLRPLYDKLRPAGRFDLDFPTLEITPDQAGQREVVFGGTILLEDFLFKISGARTRTTAILTTEGTYSSARGFERCHVDVRAPNFRIQGKMLTSLTAQMDYRPADRIWSVRRITADCYGGKLVGSLDFHQKQNGQMEYLLEVTFDRVDLRQFLADTKLKADPAGPSPAGTMAGALSLSATIGDDRSRLGSCKIWIGQMQIARLSPLVKLLQVLKLSVPTDFAFDQLFLDSYIRHDQLLVKKLDLAGPSLAFYGSGTVNLETRQIGLTLVGRGRRLASADPTLLQSITEGIGKAMVQLQLSGSFYDPQVRAKPLPVLTDTLSKLPMAVELGGGSK